jgi:hypothetical protein
VPSGGRALVGCLIVVDHRCLFVVRYVRCQHPHLPLRAVARRQGGGAVLPMVVVKCGAIHGQAVEGVVSGDMAGLRGGKGACLPYDLPLSQDF